MKMVEVIVISETSFYCVNCNEELATYDSDEENARCALCDGHFHDGEAIICEPCHDNGPDGEDKHYHKSCYKQYCDDLAEMAESASKMEESK
jgi:hypothetical protein